MAVDGRVGARIGIRLCRGMGIVWLVGLGRLRRVGDIGRD